MQPVCTLFKCLRSGINDSADASYEEMRPCAGTQVSASADEVKARRAAASPNLRLNFTKAFKVWGKVLSSLACVHYSSYPTEVPA